MPGPLPDIFVLAAELHNPEQPAHACYDVMRRIIRPDLVRVGRGEGRPRGCEVAVIDIDGDRRQDHVADPADRLIGENRHRIVGAPKAVAEIAGDLGGADAAADMRRRWKAEAKTKVADEVSHFDD